MESWHDKTLQCANSLWWSHSKLSVLRSKIPIFNQPSNCYNTACYVSKLGERGTCKNLRQFGNRSSFWRNWWLCSPHSTSWRKMFVHKTRQNLLKRGMTNFNQDCYFQIPDAGFWNSAIQQNNGAKILFSLYRYPIDFYHHLLCFLSF